MGVIEPLFDGWVLPTVTLEMKTGPFKLVYDASPFSSLLNSIVDDKPPLCIPSRGRAADGYFFQDQKRIKIVVVEPAFQRGYTKRLTNLCTKYNLQAFGLLVLPKNDRGVAFAREISLRFLREICPTLHRFYMADDDLCSAFVAEITDGEWSKGSTPHKGTMKWKECKWSTLFDTMETLAPKCKATLLAPTCSNDKKYNHATQFPEKEVRNCTTIQQLVLVNLREGKKLSYLLPDILEWSDTEWKYCIGHKAEDNHKIQKRLFQCEDFFISTQVAPAKSLVMVRFAVGEMKLVSQAGTVKASKRSPKVLKEMLNSPEKFSPSPNKKPTEKKNKKSEKDPDVDALIKPFKMTSLNDQDTARVIYHSQDSDASSTD